MRRFLVGTAGHIDHGKTALVKALTGIDADRLPEEKKRGITIDLGFAHAEWEGVRLSFVDVPGHERFVRNMLAGAGGIDAVLLVVAADESVMPQTREHFEIVRLLGIRRGVVAVTKIDRVTRDLVEITSAEVRDLTKGSFLEKAPVVPVSARSGEGLAELKRALLSVAFDEGSAAREARGVRLPVDRAFSIAGFGPVVTGSLVSGTISKDQKLELLPAGRPVRVRRLEVHGREVPEARAGERVSANLAGVELEELHRGVVLGTPGAFAVSALLTARLELLPGVPPVKSGDRLSFHHYSAEARAAARVLAGRVLQSGESGRVQLRLSRKVAALPGDRFVLRRLSPVETIGGGVVLDPLWPPVRRSTPEALAQLDRLDSDLSGKLLAWIEQARDAGVAEEALAARAGVSREEVRAAMAGVVAAGRAHVLRRSPERYISEEALAKLAARARAEIEKALEGASGAVGVSRGTLLARLLPSADPRWAEAIEKAMVARGGYLLAGEEARLLGREDLPGAERQLSERVAEAFRKRGLDPPSLPDVAQEVGHKPKVVEGLASYLVKKGELLRLPGGWIISRDAVDGVIQKLRASGKQTFEVPEFKEMFGLTRRLAIPLLEYLDGAKVTRRVGEKRQVISPG
ncbi:MAG TPA: selenocysteine-specific translation elongation factor [Thermoanaerobaculia bacterium]|nr:selenocysteine-specific translation elongation factor [Thermoanaerobaculia bacterium]